MDRRLRDVRARELRNNGYAVTVHTSRRVALHPDYVIDAEGHPGRGTNGSINGWYDTMWDAIYTVEARPGRDHWSHYGD